jgi:FAD-dependent urate hydroxylase
MASINASPLRIAIIGGSVAGLSLALSLHKAGLPCTVYEGYPESFINGGFSIAPHGTAILSDLGLLETYLSKVNSLEFFQLQDYNGYSIGRMTMFNPNRNAPCLGITRNTLLSVMLDDLKAKKIPLLYSKKLASIEETDHSVIGKFEDGSEVEADILVGADGVNSVVRKMYVLPEAPGSTYTGVSGIGGLVDVSLIDNAEQYIARYGKSATLTNGPQGFFGWMYSDNNKIMWWHHEHRSEPFSKEVTKSDDWEDFRQRMLTKFSSFPAPIPELIAKANNSVRHNIKQLAPLSTWHKGRVVLIGDAAHSLGPSSGGASLALEDSLYLAMCLRDLGSDFNSAFAAYEKNRVPRIEETRQRQQSRGRLARGEQSWLSYKLSSWTMWLFFKVKSMTADPTWQYVINWNEEVQL